MNEYNRGTNSSTQPEDVPDHVTGERLNPRTTYPRQSPYFIPHGGLPDPTPMAAAQEDPEGRPTVHVCMLREEALEWGGVAGSISPRDLIIELRGERLGDASVLEMEADAPYSSGSPSERRE